MTNNWIDEENARASVLAKTGATTNNNAPLLVKTTKNLLQHAILRAFIFRTHIA